MTGDYHDLEVQAVTADERPQDPYYRELEMGMKGKHGHRARKNGLARLTWLAIFVGLPAAAVAYVATNNTARDVVTAPTSEEQIANDTGKRLADFDEVLEKMEPVAGSESRHVTPHYLNDARRASRVDSMLSRFATDDQPVSGRKEDFKDKLGGRRGPGL